LDEGSPCFTPPSAALLGAKKKCFLSVSLTGLSPALVGSSKTFQLQKIDSTRSFLTKDLFLPRNVSLLHKWMCGKKPLTSSQRCLLLSFPQREIWASPRCFRQGGLVLILFPEGTCLPFVSRKVSFASAVSGGSVSRFGDLRITIWVATPRSVSPPPTSFFVT